MNVVVAIKENGKVFVGGDSHSHTYGSWEVVINADCVHTGTKKKVCTVCGNEITETILALGHNYVDHICTACGESER